MKTFKTFLEEQHNEDAVFQELAQYIKSECSDWIKKSGNKLVYRGMKEPKGSPLKLSDEFNSYFSEFTDFQPLIITARKDRHPRDTNHVFHDKFNKALEKHFGVKYRSTAVFVSESVAMASNYGRAFAIFPRGECNFIWSDIILDALEISESGGIFGLSENYSSTVEARFLRLIKESVEEIGGASESFLKVVRDAKQIADIRVAYFKHITTGKGDLDNTELAEREEFLRDYREFRYTIRDRLLDKNLNDLYFENKPLTGIRTEIMVSCKDYIAMPRGIMFKLIDHLK